MDLDLLENNDQVRVLTDNTRLEPTTSYDEKQSWEWNKTGGTDIRKKLVDYGLGHIPLLIYTRPKNIAGTKVLENDNCAGSTSDWGVVKEYIDDFTGKKRSNKWRYFDARPT